MSIVSDLWSSIAELPGTRRHTWWRTTDVIIRTSDSLSTWEDSRLLQVSNELRWKARSGDSLRSIIPMAFALVREASHRVHGMKHFPVQVLAGLVMADGGVAEMETGEGKTLSSLLPVFLRALIGEGCHVLTTNDYLASRDAGFAGPVFARLGVSVGFLSNSKQHEQRRQAYACDVTYGTEKELGFDFLRDRLQQQTPCSPDIPGRQESVQRGHYFALIDEADSIMIDQARTPLLIAMNQECSGATASLFHWSDRFSLRLQEQDDYRYRPELRSAQLTRRGYQRVLLESKPHLVASHGSEAISHQVERALTARLGFTVERDYIVIDGKLQIVDESTGRIIEGRKWQDRLQHAIEVKEQLKLSSMTRETARISVQSYLKQYRHLAGMTGTAIPVKRELYRVYSVRVQRIPVHRPCQRTGLPTRVFRTMDDKLNAIIYEIGELQRKGRAVLVGTPSVSASAMLSEKLRETGITHELLHAGQDQREAEIVAGAGVSGSVVVATNMAGRGTDIQISKDVRRLGGLHVIETEMHSSARIDRQLVGRAARRGDPGSYQLFLSFDDELIQSLPQIQLRAFREDVRASEAGELSRKYAAIFEKARLQLEQRHEHQRRKLLLREKQVREMCEELGLSPWLESFELNQSED
ncbi:MAG: helicase-related protein [Fuerstiella sp.]